MKRIIVSVLVAVALITTSGFTVVQGVSVVGSGIAHAADDGGDY